MLNQQRPQCMSDLSRTEYYRYSSYESVSFKPVPGLGGYDPDDSAAYPFYVQEIKNLHEQRSADVPGGRKLWKDFAHYKRRFFPTQAAATVLHPTVQLTEHGGYSGSWYHLGEHKDPFFGWRGFGTPDYPYSGIPALYSPAATGLDFIPKPSNLESLIEASIATMLPSAKAELSLLNSLYELKDFKSLPSTLAKLSSLPEAIKKLRGLTKLREALRGGSDGYLQAKFNLLPLLSDISGLARAVESHQRRINALVAASAKWRVRHYNVDLSDNPTSVSTHGPYSLAAQSTPSVYPTISGLNYTHRQVVSTTSKFHAQIAYNYHYTQYQRENAHVLALLDAVGLNLNPAIIWNAIPWSFVVDWVFGVNRWLKQFTVANMEPTINIQQYLWSTTKSRVIATQLQTGVNPFGYSGGQTTACGRIEETAYRRQASTPLVNLRAVILRASGLSPQELSLGAALVLSRRKRRNPVWYTSQY